MGAGPKKNGIAGGIGPDLNPGLIAFVYLSVKHWALHKRRQQRRHSAAELHKTWPPASAMFDIGNEETKTIHLRIVVFISRHLFNKFSDSKGVDRDELRPLSQPSGLSLGLQQCQNVSFSDRSLHVTDDRSIWLVQELNAHLGALTLRSGPAQHFGHSGQLNLVHCGTSKGWAIG